MLSQATLCNLSAIEGKPCISIYGNVESMSAPDPKHQYYIDGHLLKHLKLLISDEQIDDLQQFLHMLSSKERSGSKRRWGYALFATKDRLEYFHCPNVDEVKVTISDAFDIKYLVPGLYESDHYYIITLDQTRLRLYRLDETVDSYTVLLEQSRTDDGTGNNSLAVHDFSLYRAFDRAVYQMLRIDNAPLLLAGSVQAQALYRSISCLSNINQAALPPLYNINAARYLAESVLSREYREKRMHAVQEYYKYQAAGQVSTDIEEILYLESLSRVRALFVSHDARMPGKRWNGAQLLSCQPSEEMQDVTDVAIRLGLLFGAEVYVLPSEEMPSPNIAAIVQRTRPS